MKQSFRVTVRGYDAIRDGQLVHVPAFTGTVELDIDLEGLANRLGIGALCNRTGKSSVCHGLIKCKKVQA